MIIVILCSAQQKNHTGRNASVKAHANGIKKAKSYPAQSLKGVSNFNMWQMPSSLSNNQFCSLCLDGS
jgi:hypothetical protein